MSAEATRHKPSQGRARHTSLKGVRPCLAVAAVERFLAGMDGAPVAVHEDLERAVDHLVALRRSGGRTGGPGIWGSIQLVASKSSPEVSLVLRVISHHIPIPGRKSSWRSSPPEVSRDGIRSGQHRTSWPPSAAHQARRHGGVPAQRPAGVDDWVLIA